MATKNLELRNKGSVTNDFTIKEEIISTNNGVNVHLKPEVNDIILSDDLSLNSDCNVKEEFIISNFELDKNDAIFMPVNENDSNRMVLHIERISSEESFNPKSHEIKMEWPDMAHEYPSIEDGSMDSDEASALNNVEACLRDELDIKNENDEESPLHKIIKEENDLTVTETNLISNKVINTTSTITNPQAGIIQSRTTKTLVMEIHPMIQGANVPLGKMGNPEEILPTNDNENESIYENAFQLNSITGDVLSLEQEAYDLLKEGHYDLNDKIFKCDKCTKTYAKLQSLKEHVKVHESIERRALGFIKGQQTRRDNLEKKMNDTPKKERKTDNKLDMQRKRARLERLENRSKIRDGKVSKLKSTKEKTKRNEEKEKQDQVTVLDKEGHKCTCTKIFKRKSSLLACLRSHEVSTDINSCYSCISCTKQFKDKEELASHRRRLHRKRFPCKFCPTDYNTRKELFKHLQIHQKVQLMEYKVISEVVKGKQKLRCFMCSKSFLELSELKFHVMEDHKEPYVCPHCNGNFAKIIDFGNHTKAYHPEVEGQSVLDVLEAFSKLVRAWKCEECNEQFHEADKFAMHQIDKHSPEVKDKGQFQCEDCQRVFISQKGLTSHKRIHHSTGSIEEAESIETGVLCVECRKICKDENSLASHMRLHSLERKYPCKFCDFRFATPEKRKVHAELHTGDMKYVCFICEYQCSSENRLQQHKISLKHVNMREFLLTGKPLIVEESPKKRVTKHEEREVKKKKESKNEAPCSSKEHVTCDVCGDMFSSEKKMLQHKQTHPFIEFPNEDKPTRIFFK